MAARASAACNTGTKKRKSARILLLALLISRVCVIPGFISLPAFKAAALIAHAFGIFCSSAAFLIWIMDD